MTVASAEVSAAPSASPIRSAERFNWSLVIIAFIVVAGIAIAKAIITAKTTPLIDDTDDAMRLVTVRDLLAGQGWWDHLQYRLNTPFGAEIHWSRLVDAPIAGILLLLRPFAGSMTETIAVYAWPLLLLLGLLTLSARVAYRLVGREGILAAVVLPALAPALMTEFSPGRIDHDSVEILLTLLMVWGTIESMERSRFAILVGLACAVSLAIGIEGLPSVICAILAIALIWVVRPDRAGAMRSFGIAFALGMIAAEINQYPPSRWFEAACDEVSLVYVAFGVGVGATLLVLSVLPLARAPAWQRLAVGGVLGGLLGLALAAAFPLCLKGPYASLDPWLTANWLNHIAEAKPLWESLASATEITIGTAFPPLLGLAIVAVRVWRVKQDRGAWLILGLFLGLAVLVMCVQIRGARVAAVLAVPAAAWLIAMARQRYLSGARISGALALLGSWLGFAGLAIAVLAVLVTAPFESKSQAAATADNGEACLMPGAFDALAKLPPARVLTPVDLGSHVLLFTPHAVVSAPYHRDQAGVRDTYRFFNGPIGDARGILAARGVSLLVICPAMPEMRGLADATPDSFVKLYARNQLPDWLQLISPPMDALKIYRVAAP